VTQPTFRRSFCLHLQVCAAPEHRSVIVAAPRAASSLSLGVDSAAGTFKRSERLSCLPATCSLSEAIRSSLVDRLHTHTHTHNEVNIKLRPIIMPYQRRRLKEEFRFSEPILSYHWQEDICCCCWGQVGSFYSFIVGRSAVQVSPRSPTVLLTGVFVFPSFCPGKFRNGAIR
jgi:hypothetical protein